MSDAIQDALRDTLRKRASTFDEGAAATRVLAVDYGQTRRRRPLVPVLGGVALSGAAAALVMALTLSSGAAPALAGWTPRPTQATPRQRWTALQRCGLGTPVLSDTRGPYTAAVFPLATGAKTCVEGGVLSFTGTASGTGEATVAPDQIQFFVSSSANSSGDSFTVLAGRVGAGVTAVAITRAGESAITASVSHGWYLVWWPASVHAASARITSTSGTHTVPLPPAVTQGAKCPGNLEGCVVVSYGSGSSSPGSGTSTQNRGRAGARAARGSSK